MGRLIIDDKDQELSKPKQLWQTQPKFKWRWLDWYFDTPLIFLDTIIHTFFYTCFPKENSIFMENFDGIQKYGRGLKTPA